MSEERKADRGTGTRPWIDRAANLALLWCGSLLAGSGLVMEYRFTPGRTRGSAVWGLRIQDWSLLHLLLGLIMIGLICLHLWRHRHWWSSVLCRRRLLALLLVGLVALALLFGPLLGPG